MFYFVEKLSETSDDFVFKGGNLLWVYIATPRTTTDLDFVTLKNNSNQTVKSILEQACARSEGIKFSIKQYKPLVQQTKVGANVVIEYQTDQGAKNQFEIDIIFATATDTSEIVSPLNQDRTILSASIENIITDKLAACHRFAAGNTRVKDYDDLWRLGQSGLSLDPIKLKSLLSSRAIPVYLDTSWIGLDMNRMWKSHRKRYQDLPEDLNVVFKDVNNWLAILVGESDD
jgi:hypothetical protein